MSSSKFLARIGQYLGFGADFIFLFKYFRIPVSTSKSGLINMTMKNCMEILHLNLFHNWLKKQINKGD